MSSLLYFQVIEGMGFPKNVHDNDLLPVTFATALTVWWRIAGA